VAKGQMRNPKEKKKPKADPSKPKPMSAYKAAQQALSTPSASQIKKP
jgi:hypothetical protein